MAMNATSSPAWRSPRRAWPAPHRAIVLHPHIDDTDAWHHSILHLPRYSGARHAEPSFDLIVGEPQPVRGQARQGAIDDFDEFRWISRHVRFTDHIDARRGEFLRRPPLAASQLRRRWRHRRLFKKAKLMSVHRCSARLHCQPSTLHVLIMPPRPQTCSPKRAANESGPRQAPVWSKRKRIWKCNAVDGVTKRAACDPRNRLAAV